MDTQETAKTFNGMVHDDLYRFLLGKKAIDQKLPECPDITSLATDIIKSYLPDGIREYSEFPVTSLGWMMLVGMAMAWYWDKDWEKYCGQKDWYAALRDKNGYDNLDDTVIKDLLGYGGEKADQVADEVAECASRVQRLLTHSHIEPGTRQAFDCYVVALRQLYLFGIAVELNALGYHMTPLDINPN